MSKARFIVVVVSVFVIFSQSTRAGEVPVKQLKTFLSATRSLSADFKQVLINEAGHPIQTSYGVFYLQRPGKFRWNYEKPFLQEIVATTGKVWFYDTDLQQVTIKKLDESVGSTPALLLSGEISLDDNFTMQEQGVNGDIQWVKLLPKKRRKQFQVCINRIAKRYPGWNGAK